MGIRRSRCVQETHILADAGDAYWLGYVRLPSPSPNDPLKGLRSCTCRYLYPAPVHDEAYRAQTGLWNKQQVNEGYIRAVRDVGEFRSFRLHKEMRPAYFEEEFYRALHASRGFHDQCIVFFPVNQDYESMFNFQRVGVARDFTATEEAIAAYALRGIKSFHRQFRAGPRPAHRRGAPLSHPARDHPASAH